MTPNQAATIIGCNGSQVRNLIRAGKIKAERVLYVGNQHGYYYSISPREARRYRDLKQTRGWPRGKSRS